MQATKTLVKEVLPRTPTIASTVWQHYTRGPPVKTWDLRLHLSVSIIRDTISRMKVMTIEEAQVAADRPVPIPDFVLSVPFTIPNSYRAESQKHMVKLLDGLDDKIGWDWKEDWKKREIGEISGEWLLVDSRRESVVGLTDEANIKRLAEHTEGRVILYLHGGAYYIGSMNTHRPITWRVAEMGAARTFVINYRLAPQHPFPAALEDALSAYLYLLQPPADSNLSPVDPKKIVIVGDSAGGGLTMALLLAIRDAGLSMPGGAVGLSPWVDLTHATPSVYSNINTDYIPMEGFMHKDSKAGRYEDVPVLKDRKVIMPGVVGGGELGKRAHYYAPNESLKIKYVSPVYDDKNFNGLPPLLIQVGMAERLRDEGIFIAHKAAGPVSGLSDTPSTGTSRNKVILELYADMPHVFHMFTFNQQAVEAMEHIGAFVKNVTSSPEIPAQGEGALEVVKVSGKGSVERVPKETLEEMWGDKVLRNWERKMSMPLEERLDMTAGASFKLKETYYTS